jgi:hypothetical protein
VGYTIERRTNFTTSSWLAFTNIPGLPQVRTVDVVTPSPAPEPVRIYRIIIPQGL